MRLRLINEKQLSQAWIQEGVLPWRTFISERVVVVFPREPTTTTTHCRLRVTRRYHAPKGSMSGQRNWLHSTPNSTRWENSGTMRGKSHSSLRICFGQYSLFLIDRLTRPACPPIRSSKRRITGKSMTGMATLLRRSSLLSAVKRGCFYFFVAA